MMVPQAVYPARHAQPVGRIFPLDIGFLTSNLMISINYRHSLWRWRSHVLTLTQPDGIAKFDPTNQRSKGCAQYGFG
jgi:hypothetical protein